LVLHRQAFFDRLYGFIARNDDMQFIPQVFGLLEKIAMPGMKQIKRPKHQNACRHIIRPAWGAWSGKRPYRGWTPDWQESSANGRCQCPSLPSAACRVQGR